jgi:hypothetical protein
MEVLASRPTIRPIVMRVIDRFIPRSFLPVERPVDRPCNAYQQSSGPRLLAVRLH